LKKGLSKLIYQAWGWKTSPYTMRKNLYVKVQYTTEVR